MADVRFNRNVDEINPLFDKIDNLTIDAALSETSENPLQNKAIYSKISEFSEKIARIVDKGEKNLLKFFDLDSIKGMNTHGQWEDNVFTVNSVDFTVNSDYSVTVNGTATNGNSILVLSPKGGFSADSGDYILSGTPNGGSTATYNISIAGVVSDLGETARFSEASKALVRLYVLEGTTVNNLTFKPMICTTAEYAISSEFVPYSPSNRELYEMIKNLTN